jgi:hypothetical protein
VHAHSQFSTCRAWLMSGQRRFGSSIGRLAKLTLDFDFISSTTRAARSLIVISCGLPKLIGPVTSLVVEGHRAGVPLRMLPCVVTRADAHAYLLLEWEVSD